MARAKAKARRRRPSNPTPESVKDCRPFQPSIATTHFINAKVAFPEHQVNDVVHTHQSSALKELKPSDFGRLLHLFTKLIVPVEQSHNWDEPPIKKRRVNGGSTVVTQKGYNANAIAIATINLHFEITTSHIIPPKAVESVGPQALPLQWRIYRAASGVFLNFTSSCPSSPSVILLSNSPELHTIFDDLENISLLQQSMLGKGKNAILDDDIMWFRTYINPSTLLAKAFDIRIDIFWNESRQFVHFRSQAKDQFSKVLGFCFPENRRQYWSPKDFYNNVLVPTKDLVVPLEMEMAAIQCKLYPFQKRAVQWLLDREKAVFKEGKVVEDESPKQNEAHLVYRKVSDATGADCYLSLLYGCVCRSLDSIPAVPSTVKGGILADEMGLGKTVELITLIGLHKRDVSSKSKVYDVCANRMVTPSQATLIITPKHLLQQWMDEVAIHAPQLRVFNYEGVSQRRHGKELTEIGLLPYDIVFTTYHVLGKEIHYTRTSPERSLRRERKYERRKSPLTEILWWRVCLDEAQMVENGSSQSARLARLIPRENAWAVSGTPFKNNIEDLVGIFSFLRFQPFTERNAWNFMDRLSFQQVFSSIAIRNTKECVSHELELPPQKRFVITAPLTVIEDQNYRRLFEEMCRDCDFTADGSPAVQGFDPDSKELLEKMRTWLRRLRQTCLHPQVGSLNRRALGGRLRTVTEVLKVMVDQNEASIRSEERNLVAALVRRGHVVAFALNETDRARQSLEFYLKANRLADEVVGECRKDLATEESKSKAITAAKKVVEEHAEEPQNELDELKAGERSRFQLMRKNLRTALESQHLATFFVASAYYQIRSDESITEKDSDEYSMLEELETSNYAKARAIRKQILRDAYTKADRKMKKVGELDLAKVVDEEPFEDLGGIENRKFMDDVNFIQERLNLQATNIRGWRQRIYDILQKKLVDDDTDIDDTGEEYEISMKEQDKLYVYFLALRTFIADRHGWTLGLRNTLVEHEVLEAKSIAELGDGHDPELTKEFLAIRQELKVDPLKGSLRSGLSNLRNLRVEFGYRANTSSEYAKSEIRVIAQYEKFLQNSISSHSINLVELEKEVDIFRDAMNQRLDYYRQLQAISDTVQPFRAELDTTLGPPEFKFQDARIEKITKKLQSLNMKRRFLRHLNQESENQGQTRMCIICTDEFDVGVLTMCGHQFCKECILEWWKQHKTCPTCKTRLKSNDDLHDIHYKSQELRAQEEVHDGQTHSRPSLSTSAIEGKFPDIANKSQPVKIYTSINAATLRDIKAIDLPSGRSYGTKIDSITRHLLYLRIVDPAAKSIIFSQYSDFLTVLSDALDKFQIGHTSISSPKGTDEFRRDPALEVFLLDAKSDSSGLNLVTATHVFLAEPLINVALELQAIARVHRIGQMKPTTVYMYLTTDTVEEVIYDISVARRLKYLAARNKPPALPQGDRDAGEVAASVRTGSENNTPDAVVGAEVDSLSLATSTTALTNTKSGSAAFDCEAQLDAVNSRVMQAAPAARQMFIRGREGGEKVDKGDVWKCLFGRRAARQEAQKVEEVARREVERHLRAEASGWRLRHAAASGSADVDGKANDEDVSKHGHLEWARRDG